MSEDISCPFCNEKGFDKIGLKHHLGNYCEIFDKVPSAYAPMEEQREFNKEFDKRDE